MFRLEDIDMGQYEFVSDERRHTEPQSRPLEAVHELGVSLPVCRECLRGYLGELAPRVGEFQAPGKAAKER
ncbi:Uncharacterised protein [Pseudomonas aeruginosa]|nr:Uncharacterised protein [Pseudomonas aeruginosa]